MPKSKLERLHSSPAPLSLLSVPGLVPQSVRTLPFDKRVAAIDDGEDVEATVGVNNSDVRGDGKAAFGSLALVRISILVTVWVMHSEASAAEMMATANDRLAGCHMSEEEMER